MLMSVTLPSIAVVPFSSHAPSTLKPADARALQLIHRLDEIMKINKSEFSRSEKKKYRKEVKAIKKEMKNTNKGVYLSIGAIIIIILLLILIL